MVPLQFEGARELEAEGERLRGWITVVIVFLGLLVNGWMEPYAIDRSIYKITAGGS